MSTYILSKFLALKLKLHTPFNMDSELEVVSLSKKNLYVVQSRWKRVLGSSKLPNLVKIGRSLGKTVMTTKRLIKYIFRCVCEGFTETITL